jgi:hypothetical protein
MNSAETPHCFSLQNQSEENLDEESVILTLVPFKEEEEPNTDYATQSNVSSSTLDHTPPGIYHPMSESWRK